MKSELRPSRQLTKQRGNEHDTWNFDCHRRQGHNRHRNTKQGQGQQNPTTTKNVFRPYRELYFADTLHGSIDPLLEQQVPTLPL